MKQLILVLLLSFAQRISYGQDSLLVMFWNVENFFDYVDDGAGESDNEFSSYGSRRWTQKRFYAKCEAVCKAIFWIGEKYGRMPDVMGLAEIENRGVLYKLLSSTLLRKYDYGIVHYESGDRRGIDVAMLYRKSVFRKVYDSVRVPEYEGINMTTRDILQVCLEDRNGRRMEFIVNHHPSKYGGTSVSEGRRMAAMTALKELCDSLRRGAPEVPVVAMGDFNDTPDGSQFNILEGVLSNKADSLFKAGQGTIRYEGKWELIDMFMVSEEVSDLCVMDIVKIPFLMTYERKYPGMKPFRTYSGPRYIGGVSDHCPIVLCIFGSY